MLRASMGFKSIKRVDIKCETTTPGEVRTTTDANGLRVSTTRARRTLPKLEFSVDESGAILHGPQRGLFPYYSAATSTTAAALGPYYHPDHAHRPHHNHDHNHNHDHDLDHDHDESEQLPMPTSPSPSPSPETAAGVRSLMNLNLGMSPGMNVPPSSRERSAAPAPSPAPAPEDALAQMKDCVLNDTRATTLALKFDASIGLFVCGSSIERFSGHTGVCRVLGSKKYPIIPHSLQIGDLLRIGSVGLVVCELNRAADDGGQESLTDDEYEYIKKNYLSLPLQQTFRPNASRDDETENEGENENEEEEEDEGDGNNDNQNEEEEEAEEDEEEGHLHNKLRAGETSDEGESEEDGQKQAGSDDEPDADGRRTKAPRGKDAACKSKCKSKTKEKRFCYICYDGEERPEENPLVAPCKCKGDTKYVHLECLQRWNNSLDSDGGNPNHKMCAVTNTDGLDVCTICKGTYLTSVKLEDGRVISLMAKKLPPPYVTFAVVTQHETRTRSTALTNTRFQLSFANVPRSQPFLTIGRSTNNNMTLRYRTVSQLHAKIKFEDNNFCLYDASSSNGTMLFLSRPLELDWNKAVHVKIGRTILTLKPKKKWKWSGGGDDDDAAPPSTSIANNVIPSPVSTPRLQENNNNSPDDEAVDDDSSALSQQAVAATPRRSVTNRFEAGPSAVSDPSAELLSSPYAIALRQPSNRTFTSAYPTSAQLRRSFHSIPVDDVDVDALRLSHLHLDDAQLERSRERERERERDLEHRRRRSFTTATRSSEYELRFSEPHRRPPLAVGDHLAQLDLLSPRAMDLDRASLQ